MPAWYRTWRLPPSVAPATRTRTRKLVVSVAPLRVGSLAGWVIGVAPCWDVSVRARREAGDGSGTVWGILANREVEVGEGDKGMLGYLLFPGVWNRFGWVG
jgi:hypothetical protein